MVRDSYKRPRAAVPQNVLVALRLMVEDYGVERLAARTGQAAGVIHNKINVGDYSHHIPTVADFMLWQTLSLDHRPLHAAAHTLGDNALILPTDTQKNTVYALARAHFTGPIEAFGLVLLPI